MANDMIQTQHSIFVGFSVACFCCQSSGDVSPYVCWPFRCGSLMFVFDVRVSVTFHLMFVGSSVVVL